MNEVERRRLHQLAEKLNVLDVEERGDLAAEREEYLTLCFPANILSLLEDPYRADVRATVVCLSDAIDMAVKDADSAMYEASDVMDLAKGTSSAEDTRMLHETVKDLAGGPDGPAEQDGATAGSHGRVTR